MSRAIGFPSTILAYTLGFAAGALAADSDQDGVEDSLDACCDTPPGITVDGDGRPISDFDEDCDGDLEDHRLLHMNLGDPGSGMADLSSFATFQLNFTGAGNLAEACCAAPLNPLDDGTELPPGGIPDIIISEIKPGEYIEVFNPTGGDVDLTFVPWRWCVPFVYQAVAVPVIVPAGAYTRLDWPIFDFNISMTESDGELILYKSRVFTIANNVLDFVCWGSPSPSRRLTQGAESGKWSGPCGPSIPPGGAIHRIAGTDGTSASSYDVTSLPSPMTCVP